MWLLSILKREKRMYGKLFGNTSVPTAAPPTPAASDVIPPPVQSTVASQDAPVDLEKKKK